VRVREDYFAPNANPRKALQIVDLPSNWPLPEKKDLLDYKPKVDKRTRKRRRKKEKEMNKKKKERKKKKKKKKKKQKQKQKQKKKKKKTGSGWMEKTRRRENKKGGREKKI
jgi:hypothetical protein